MTCILETARSRRGVRWSRLCRDSLGFVTVGIGRLIDKRRGGGITHGEALYLLGNDVARITHDLLRRFRWFDGLDAAPGGAGRHAFQMGVTGCWSFERTLLLIEAQPVRRGCRRDADQQIGQPKTLAAPSAWPNRCTGEWQFPVGA